MHRSFLKAASFVTRNEQHERAASLLGNRERMEAVTLGNSHSDSINYSALGIERLSRALPAADLFGVERYAAYLNNELPALKTVFIAVSYYSFSWDNATIEPCRERRMAFIRLFPLGIPFQEICPCF
jgi:hypothetical protein